MRIDIESETRVKITDGYLWWKKVAFAYKNYTWFFVSEDAIEYPVNFWLVEKISEAIDTHKTKEAYQRIWRKPPKLPKAKEIKR